MLPLLADNALPMACRPELLSYCPSMDLLAVATVDEHLHVYRLNGQKVFTVVSRKIKKITQLTWKPNGQSLPYSDHTTTLLNGLPRSPSCRRR